MEGGGSNHGHSKFRELSFVKVFFLWLFKQSVTVIPYISFLETYIW